MNPSDCVKKTGSLEGGFRLAGRSPGEFVNKEFDRCSVSFCVDNKESII